MADVRALLRNERLARRIAHPNAIYSSSGTLSCNVCNLRLQADSLWGPHLAGKVHRQNLQRQQSAPSASLSVAKPPSSTSTMTMPHTTNGTGRKRKADDEDVEDIHFNGKKRKAADYESEDDTRQESTSAVGEVSMPSAFTNGSSSTKTNTDIPSKQDEMDEEESGNTESTKELISSTTAIPAASGVDEDEYAAFEAAIADVTADNESTQRPAVSALMSGADIAAAPITAAELASRQADELNQQRKGRDAEIDGEKEDAARALEEEFDEMDQLEARVRKLREMRERLRTTLPAKSVSEKQAEEDTIQPSVAESDDDEDDDGYDDDWRF